MKKRSMKHGLMWLLMGKKVRLNLKDLWKTGCEEKGGIVIYEIKEQKRIKMTKFHIFLHIF